MQLPVGVNIVPLDTGQAGAVASATSRDAVNVCEGSLGDLVFEFGLQGIKSLIGFDTILVVEMAVEKNDADA